MGGAARHGRHAGFPRRRPAPGGAILSRAGALAGLAGRGIAWAWRWLGPRGRLIALMPLAEPLARLAGDAALITDSAAARTLLAASIVLAASLGLLGLRLSGQRRWREDGPTVLTGGLARYAENHAREVAGHLAELGAMKARMGAAEAETAWLCQRVAALSGAMAAGSAAVRAAVAPVPFPQTAGRPDLRVVGEQRGA